jgi:hypothetical protein
VSAGGRLAVVAGLAICQYEGQDGFYLFGCDSEWNTIWDSWHPTVEHAMSGAEEEYEGVSQTWEKPT